MNYYITVKENTEHNAGFRYILKNSTFLCTLYVIYFDHFVFGFYKPFNPYHLHQIMLNKYVFYYY